MLNVIIDLAFLTSIVIMIAVVIIAARKYKYPYLLLYLCLLIPALMVNINSIYIGWLLYM